MSACTKFGYAKNTYCLKLFLDLSDATGRVIRVCGIIFIYPYITASSCQDQIDDFSQGSRFVFTESRDPARRHILETVTAGEYIGYDAISWLTLVLQDKLTYRRVRLCLLGACSCEQVPCAGV